MQIQPDKLEGNYGLLWSMNWKNYTTGSLSQSSPTRERLGCSKSPCYHNIRFSRFSDWRAIMFNAIILRFRKNVLDYCRVCALQGAFLYCMTEESSFQDALPVLDGTQFHPGIWTPASYDKFELKLLNSSGFSHFFVELFFMCDYW